MATSAALDELSTLLSGLLPGCHGSGSDGLIAVATHPDVDFVLCASSGTAALEAVLAAIEAGKTIGLANKEVLVMAGGLVMDAARRKGVAILPVDSEHNAIHQCLHGREHGELRRLILTASGGPFRGRTRGAGAVTAADALKHPTWQMGPKITIDSATLMNKGLEVIEAHWLFGASASQIDVVVHPQSIVHSLVELEDGSVIAQMGTTDMRLPIHMRFRIPIAGTRRCRVSISPARRRSSSTSRPGTIFPASGWPTGPSRPNAACPWCSMRPTKSPWRLFSRAA